MNFLKKSAAGLLAATLLATTGCSGDTSWVYRVDGIQPPAGVYLIYMINSASEAESKLDEGHGEEGHEHEDIKYKDMLKMTLEDQTVSQWVESGAQRQLREYLAVEKQFTQRGLTLSDSESATAKAAAASNWQNYGEFYEKNGVAQSSMELQMQNGLKSQALFMSIYGEGGEQAVPESELTEAFTREYARIQYTLFTKAAAEKENEDGTTVSVEDQDALAKSQAEAFRSRLDAGEAFEDLVFEQETAEYAGTETEVTKPEPGQRELILSESMKGTYFSDELVDGAKALEVGKSAVLEDDSFYYVVRKLDITEDPATMETYRTELLTTLKQEEFDETLAGWVDEVNPEVNEAAIAAYKPEKLKID